MAEKINFKSVGQKAADRQTEISATGPSIVPVGIKTPLRLGTVGSAVFAMHSSITDQLEDNLRNLIQTNHGERLGMYNFGANLRPLMTEITSRSDFESAAMARIRTAVARFMPYVKLNTFTSEIVNDRNATVGKIVLKIGYDIPQAGVSDRQISVQLFVA